MEERKIVVVVEDVEAARTALRWALHNLLRYGDLVTLLHVFSSSSGSNRQHRHRNRLRLLRLNGFHLALSFKDICTNHFPFTKMEIVVTEGDRDGRRLAAVVREIGASALVAGLHDQSFLHKLAIAHTNIATNFNCKVLAIKQPPPLMQKSTALPQPGCSTNMDFSQIEITRLPGPHVPPPKIPYRIFPSLAILWRSRRTKKRESSWEEA
ncbi:uncharacterized protein LOC131146477 [Malania oleifera]|uniref:uncharacterized protein LOC131146477 n=1 Tax=Malania oleifera TaxID=397392 RepID=UPI0025ADDFCE|nr:uncharacterized protein LOC131146477 [Malania oleifera]